MSRFNVTYVDGTTSIIEAEVMDLHANAVTFYNYEERKIFAVVSLYNLLHIDRLPEPS